MRACRDLGIQTVAAYTRADRNLLHLRHVDEAVCVGERDYLNINNHLMAARATNCDAIHPGYGFLAENADFAAATEAAGLVFVGPSAAHIRLMGDKVKAREKALELGLSLTPGTAALDALTVAQEAQAIGYPLILKAAAGGGGRGMRVVAGPDGLNPALLQAKEEANTFFGDGTIYLERFYPDARHVEVQVLGDGQGHAVHLFTRDCSVQRRHQKLVEESPAPCVASSRLDELAEQCASIAATMGYSGAGTFEFLLAEDQLFFMEMNTRLQVEHTVTECITGVDLVRAQLSIAGGETVLPAGVTVRGHAIECRINAEDEQYRPSPGRVNALVLPAGPGVRVDTHLYPGYEVPHFYDSLVAKVIAHAETRTQAIAVMLRALRELRIEGIDTNRERHIRILSSPAFAGGGVGTSFMDTLA